MAGVLLSVAILYLSQSAAADTDAKITTETGLRYDGHGALSAGASSRLLYDYPEPERSDILDYLFTPNFGASLHLIKVEIGGDGQSTDGTEAAHMHNRDDLSCERPYEFWLLEEARKRNPAIVTYVLSWAEPYWVGNQTGFYSDDTIDFHLKWMECTRDYEIGNLDYIGNWNERAWGTPDWTINFKRAMEDAGWDDTQIILPDGGFSESLWDDIQANDTLSDAVAGIGLHYPCDHPYPAVVADGKKYWASEDYSTVGNWAGAGCWGRILNENFNRMNMTSTIAWSLIWSVYPVGFPYFGNGLMYAFEPWSGHYTVNSPIWTSAHTCQFTQVGWTMHTGMNGSLADGGTYVVYTDPDRFFMTIVIEKLEGDCLRCKGRSTSDETVTLELMDGVFGKNGTVFQVWSTTESMPFAYQGNITVSNGKLSVDVKADSIVTVSNWFNGQSRGSKAIPSSQPFPKPYADNFDSYRVDDLAKYFADDGGSFQTARSPDGDVSRGMVLKQWVLAENGVNRWGKNTPPITYIGDMNWTDTNVTVEVYITPSTMPSPPGPSPAGYNPIINAADGYCLDVVGQSTVPGNPVDTYPCVNQGNEMFYDANLGHIVGSESKLCLSAYGCNSSAVCQQPCTTTPLSQWIWNTTGGTIALRSSPASCLTVNVTGGDNHPLHLQPCKKNLVEQIWSKNYPLPKTNAAGVCIRASFDRPSLGASHSGICVQVATTGDWVVTVDKMLKATGKAPIQGNEWHTLNVGIQADVVRASIDGNVVYTASEVASPEQGMVTLHSTYQYTYFDNFQVT